MTFRLISILVLITLILSFCSKNPIVSNYEDRILFIRTIDGENEIATSKPDGSDIQILKQHVYNENNLHEGYYMVRWSPDRSRIVLQGGPDSGSDNWALWVMDEQANLLDRLTLNCWHPLWLNNTEIVYRRFLARVIHKVNINTQEEQTICDHPDTVSIVLTDISNSGDYALGFIQTASYDSSGDLQWKPLISIAEFQLPLCDNYRILRTEDNIWSVIEPKWNPDESLVAFGTLENGIPNVHLITSEGENIKQLTNETIPNYHAYHNLVWSPDGTQLAYSKADQIEDYNPYTDIFIIDIETGSVDQVTSTSWKGGGNSVMDWK